MATIRFHNSLTKHVEEFSPVNADTKGVSMYTCGPTIYNAPHIGNYRAYIFADILRRTLAAHGYTVNQIINLTDVDDKTIKKSRELGISLEEMTKQYEQDFYDGRKELHLLPASHYPRATGSIPKIIEVIELLLEKNFAYRSEDGSVYFRVSSDPHYGQLVDIDPNKIKENAGGRMDNDEYDKDTIQDFALWKAWDEKDGPVKWNSPWGEGHPGWHIECSAMIREFIGDIVDIHTGGIDNMFPHHENEIAQSECAYDHTLSRFFVHCNHLLIDGKKMAKSDGNFLMLSDFRPRGISPLSYKYFLYGTHYRSPANMTWDAIYGAQTTLKRMYEKYITIMHSPEGSVDRVYLERVKAALASDLNTAEAIAVFIELFDDTALSDESKLATVHAVDTILGLGFIEYHKRDKTLPYDIKKIADERNMAREAKNYERSDELREILSINGYLAMDTKEGSIVVRNPLN